VEVLEEKVDARIKAAEERAAQAEQVARGFIYEQTKSAALAQLTPALTAEFPLVTHFMGPEQALTELQEACRVAGKNVDAAAFFRGK
jgi:hypothetical protein